MEDLVERADFFFAAVPHKTAMDLVPVLLRAGKKLVDLSADFRIRDAAIYEEWYQPHSSAELIAEAVYGLPELYRDQVKGARLTANQGSSHLHHPGTGSPVAGRADRPGRADHRL